MAYVRSEEQLEHDRKRRLAHYHANKSNPEYMNRRRELALAWKRANKEKLKEQRKMHIDRAAKRKGLDVLRAEWAEKRKRCLDVERKKNPARLQRIYFARNLRTKFGLSVFEYAMMERDQDYCCAACGLPFTSENYATIDHCHASGKIRGLLHNKCNAALGMMRDNLKTLQCLADYLRSHL